MSIGQLCNRDTVIARKQDSITTAAQLMRQHHVGCVIVVEDDGDTAKPVGIVTDRDLVIEILAKEVDPDSVSLGDIMSFNLVTANEDDRLWDTLQLMRTKGIRRVPVVSYDGALQGILSSDDLLEVLASEMGELAKLISREQLLEKKTRADA